MVINTGIHSADGSGMDSARPTGAKEKRLVEIKWRDILQCSGWEKADDVEVPQFISIGWLVSRDGKQIKIASTLDYADAFGDAKDEAKPVPYGITAFPAGCVDDITFLDNK
tara:strand:+ start:119 stop:451 length:333 start_codon:yes stop_codon:yes gene_type:complete